MNANSKLNACGVCGAELRDSVKYGWGTYRQWACGAVSDDGPGYPCPNTPKAEAKPETIAETSPASPAVTEVVETFPVVLVSGVLEEVRNVQDLTKVDRVEAVLAHIETFANMVVTKDDKKGAALADERRKLAKRVRTTAVRICKEQREDAVEELKKIQAFWISIGDKVANRCAAVEEHLEAQVKIYADEQKRLSQVAALEKERIAKAEKEEADRKAAEAAAEVKRVLQARIQRLMDLGAAPNVVQIATATDDEFETIVAAAAEAQAAKLAQQETERIERERLATEQRVRAELIQLRTSEVSRAGLLPWWASLDALADMTDDEFRSELAERIEAKILADQDAERRRTEAEAAEAKRVQAQAEADATRAAEQARMDAERAALEADRRELAAQREKQEATEREAGAERRRVQEAEEARQAAEAQQIADEERAAAEAARIEAERPDREKVLAWLARVETEVVTFGPGKIESPAVRDWFDGHQTILIRAIQAAKKDFST